MAIDTRTDKVVASIPVGSYPYAMAITPNGKTVYVANGNSGSVSVISTAINQAVATISVGSLPVAIAVAPSGHFIYVVNDDSNSVSQIDTSTNRVTGTVDVGELPSQIAVTPNGVTAYVGELSNAVVPVDLRTMRAGKPIPLAFGALQIVMAD